MQNLHPEYMGGKPGSMGGTNQGRVAVPVAGIGEDAMAGTEKGKGKARIALGVPVKLAMDDANMGGYKK